MKRKVYIFALICLSISGVLSAQVPPLHWAIQTNSPDFKTFENMALDHDGNILTVIRANSVFDFAGIEMSAPNLLDNQAFGSILIKIDPNGEVLWFRSLRGPWQIFTSLAGIDIDAENNIYVSYYGSSQLENASPIGGLYALSPRTTDNFIVKISPDGEGMWYVTALNIGSIGTTPGVKVSTDGAVYLCGRFAGSVIFGGTTLVNQNIGSLFLVKFNADGDVLWSKTISSLNGDVGLNIAMETASDGSLYLAGTWRGDSLNVGHLSVQNELAFTLNSDRWIAKIGPDGTAQWLVREHSSGSQSSPILKLTPEDELMVISSKGEDQLSIGDFVLNASGNVLSRYSASGEVISASLFSGYTSFPSSIASIGDGAYFFASSFSDPSLSFGGLEVFNTGGFTGTRDAFVAKMNALGEAEWIYSFGNEETEIARNVSVSEMGRLVLGGSFSGFELDIQGTLLLANTPFVEEHFIASFSTALATRSATALKQLLAYPNPFSENVQFDAEALKAFQNATLTVYSSSGAEVHRATWRDIESGQISLAHLPQGAYVARISDGEKSLHTKIVKQ